ncbi:hypothetical protein ACVFI8_00070 [Agarivorans sp. MS3-6]
MRHAYYILGSLLIICIPTVPFLIKFHGQNISDDPSDWAAFASYIAGTIGTTFAMISAFFLLQTLRSQKEAVESQKQAVINQTLQAKKQLYEERLKPIGDSINEMLNSRTRIYSNKTLRERTNEIGLNFPKEGRGMLLDGEEDIAIGYLKILANYFVMVGTYHKLLDREEIQFDINYRTTDFIWPAAAFLALIGYPKIEEQLSTEQLSALDNAGFFIVADKLIDKHQSQNRDKSAVSPLLHFASRRPSKRQNRKN